ncbi:hypothetical protein [Acaryochloris sp. 'Moss Beach']|uniref:hypothetical protein n=1 Tax=Acaryochloris sp. 'Moss Beach' TaxID=2740837 RepID=UPI001F3ACF93|nr:hypothetical protein [Acaryochloris sp. 'Moss Beach']
MIEHKVELVVDISASPDDADYDMAYVYCFDAAKNYCFSLSRFPNAEQIEVMVLNQLVSHVDDVTISVSSNLITATLEEETAASLDGYQYYDLQFELTPSEMTRLIDSLKRIFNGKSGLSINTP